MYSNKALLFYGIKWCLVMEVVLKDTVTHFSITSSSNKSTIIIQLLAADGLLFIELLHMQPTLIFSLHAALLLTACAL